MVGPIVNLNEAVATAAQEELAVLAAIDRSALSEIDRRAYDVFKYQREDDLADVQPEMLALTVVRPINHFSGFHTFYPVFASGRNAAPFRNLEDYENNLKRHREFVVGVDRAIARFREGLASGVVETKLTIRNVVDQLDRQLATPPESLVTSGPWRLERYVPNEHVALARNPYWFQFDPRGTRLRRLHSSYRFCIIWKRKSKPQINTPIYAAQHSTAAGCPDSQ